MLPERWYWWVCWLDPAAAITRQFKPGVAPSTETITKAWASGWILGLVPPSTIETAQKCPNGVAKVETQQSFGNQLVGFLTLGIYTPMDIRGNLRGQAGGHPRLVRGSQRPRHHGRVYAHPLAGWNSYPSHMLRGDAKLIDQRVQVSHPSEHEWRELGRIDAHRDLVSLHAMLGPLTAAAHQQQQCGIRRINKPQPGGEALVESPEVAPNLDDIPEFARVVVVAPHEEMQPSLVLSDRVPVAEQGGQGGERGPQVTGFDPASLNLDVETGASMAERVFGHEV